MSTRDAVIQALKALHENEETVYTGCRSNCGSANCILKIRRKNGVITAIEPDDHYQPGVGREDALLSDADIAKMRLQLRGCPMAWVWHKFTYSPDRILYPMKRAEGAKRGEGEFERISWNEALDLMASKITEIVEEYGPYSILCPGVGNNFERLMGLWGAGVAGWGGCSMDAERLATSLMANIPEWAYSEGSNGVADTLLHTKMAVLWGYDPTAVHLFGGAHMLAYFLRMARERGIPIICIEPRYTVAAEVLADQWIPIKPGTDTAMMLAIADVLLRENLYNKQYVTKYVDEEGFARWRSYLLGEGDGVEKTPEWAEAICGVPAETIRSFARLYARMSPTWLWVSWGVCRKSRGENTARAAAALQALMGYWGVPGGSVPLVPGNRQKPAVMLPYGDLPRRMVPRMYRANKWAQAVLLLDKVQAGEMSPEEYKANIGWRAQEWTPLPNPKMLMWGGAWSDAGSTPLNNTADSTNDMIRALERMEFVAWIQTRWTPMARYADLVLPVLDDTLEESQISGAWPIAYGGFSNYTFNPGVAQPPGEARSVNWVYTELARKLGIGEEWNRFYRDGNWNEEWEGYLQGEYDRAMAQLEQWAGATNLPSWEQFKQGDFVNVEEYFEQPYYGYKSFVEEGKPLNTRSGKIEIYSSVLTDDSRRGKLQWDHTGRMLDNMPNDWKDLAPIPIYQPAYRGLEHRDAREFPLMLLTPYPRYRNHSIFWDVPWIRGDCYRHACWINVADAQARGIKAGDLVRVHNDKGVVALPAYVTSRILPGIVAIHHGGWYQPDEQGVDWGCTPNVLLGDLESPPISAPVTTLVEVRKYEGPRKQTSWLAMDQLGSGAAGQRPEARGNKR